MSTWGEVLKQAGYPQTAIVLDFETYYDADYSLKKMSTVEYVMDKRFEVLGLGIRLFNYDPPLAFSAPVGFGKDCSIFLQSQQIVAAVGVLTAAFGKALERCTVVCQNCFFDCLILQEHFGITPRYTVDIRDLDRMWDARAKHSLEVMAKRWKAPTLKGDTKQFKGLHWADMTPEQQKALGDYCKNDVEIESFLFQQLLPLAPNPQIELPLATQTLQLFLKPQIQIDQQLGEELKEKMQLEVLNAIDAVEWVSDYAD